jgi:hypothetical protein
LNDANPTKGETTMKYTKPEVTPLGDAMNLIQGGEKDLGCCPEGTRVISKPAYEADE